MRLLICLLTCIFCGTASAADASWTPIKLGEWKGKQSAPGRYDLAQGMVHTEIDLAPVEGQWIRLSATASASAPDFSAWVQVLDANDKVISRVLPTLCELIGPRKRCHTVAWVRPGGARLRLAFYANTVPVEITPEVAEWARARPATPQVLANYLSLRDTIRKRYFRSSSADWTMSALERGALDAPDGIDPAPHALLTLVASLPDHKHTQLIHDNQSAPATMPLVLPTCSRRADGVWRLRMPQTPNKEAHHGLYIDAVRECIEKAPAATWLVDLSEHQGGNTMLTFAALWPVLGSGPMMKYVYPDNNSVTLTLDSNSVTVGTAVYVIMSAQPVRLKGSVRFLLGPHCMSACESVAIAVKGKFPTIGQPTGGYTSLNDTIRINPQMQIALTVGMQADLSGKTYDTVVPDELLDDVQMAAALSDARGKQ